MNTVLTLSSKPQTVLGICGSLRVGSYSMLAMQHVLAAAQRSGLNTDSINTDDLRLPLCDASDPSEHVLSLRERVANAAALVLVTPEYCGTLSAVIKNLIEWLGHGGLHGHIAAVVSVAAGNSADGSLHALRHLCLQQGMWVVPITAAVPFAERVFDQRDDPFSAMVLSHLDELGATLSEATQRLVRGDAKETENAA